MISGIVCAFAALCYVEFAAMVPVAGSAYTYGYASLGELLAWIIGWDLILEYSVSIAAVAAGWSGYIASLSANAGLILPAAFVNPAGVNGGILNVPCILVIAAITTHLIVGVKESARFNNIIVTIKLSVIVLFLYLASSHIRPVLRTPFLPFGWTGVLTGAAIVFFAYIEFDAVSTAAEEAKDPQRSLPIGIIGSLVISTILYITVSAVLKGIVPYTTLNTSAPVAFSLQEIGIQWGSALVSVGARCGITAVLLVLMYGQTQIFFAMSRDGLLPRTFRELHLSFRTPAKVTLLVRAVTAIIASTLSLQSIAELVNIGTLAAFIIVSLGVLVLRYRRPELERPFRCPIVPVVPVLCILSCGLPIYALPLVTHFRFVIWLAIGLVIYFLYSMKHSRINEDTKEVECY